MPEEFESEVIIMMKVTFKDKLTKEYISINNIIYYTENKTSYHISDTNGDYVDLTKDAFKLIGISEI